MSTLAIWLSGVDHIDDYYCPAWKAAGDRLSAGESMGELHMGSGS